MEKNKYTEFLKELARECYFQGDNFHADKLKRGYAFGYTNDYPLQHGKGESIILPDSFVEFLYNKLNPESKELSLPELIDHFNSTNPLKQ